MEIKINNSKLKIVKVHFRKGDYSITLINKPKLKYQFVVFTDPVDKKLCPQKKVDTTGLTKIFLESSISDNYNNCWSLELEKSSSIFKDVSYNLDEIRVIMSFIYITALDHQDTSEILSLCTQDSSIISKFYSSYGKQGITEFKNFIKNCLTDIKYSPKITKEFYPINYSKNRYSIQDLISDLISDNAEILTNKYLVGEVENISMKKEDTSNLSAPSDNEWCKITGILGNKTRANLSLRFTKKVLVSIPENDLGIDTGMKEFDSFGAICIIKDGILWQKTLGVKISNKLAGKLKKLGMVKGELLYSGEYLIDLSVIPIVSKSRLKGISSSYLADLEIKYLLANTAIEYLNYMYPDTPTPSSKEDEFYNKLRIFNGVYCPKTKTVKTGKSYITTELVSEVSGIANSQSEMIKEFWKIKNKKLYSGIIYDFIRNLGVTSDNVSDLKKKWKLEKEKISVELRDSKFQIIMSKSSKFSEKGTPFIDNIVKSVNMNGYFIRVSWKFKQKTVSL